MSKVFKIKDMNNEYHTVSNIDEFIDHIFKFHSSGTSIHEENGFFFEIDNAFREKIRKYKRQKFT